MKANRNKKYIAGGALAAGAGQGVLGLAQGIHGMIQSSRAKKALKELYDKRPNVGVPSAYRELADEPIAEQFMRAKEEAAQRRTGQAVDALGKGGSRTLLGGVPQVLDQERIAENQRMGEYEQARKSALGNLAGAQERAIGRKTDMWNQQVQGAQIDKAGGTQNIFGGLGQVGRGLGFLTEEGLFNKKPNERIQTSSPNLSIKNPKSLNIEPEARGLMGVNNQPEIDNDYVHTPTNVDFSTQEPIYRENDLVGGDIKGFNPIGAITGLSSIFTSPKKQDESIVELNKKSASIPRAEVKPLDIASESQRNNNAIDNSNSVQDLVDGYSFDEYLGEELAQGIYDFRVKNRKDSPEAAKDVLKKSTYDMAFKYIQEDYSRGVINDKEREALIKKLEIEYNDLLNKLNFIDSGKKGKYGMKFKTTEGAYNHDKNPLILTDKKGIPTKDKETGKTIELTGQETILNPEQRKKMESLEGKALKSYINNLFSQKRFK